MTKNKSKGLKNATITTTIAGLAGTGLVKLIEWGSVALATGTWEPTAATFQGVFGLLAAGGIAYMYTQKGVTSLPIDDSGLQEIIDALGKAADEAENDVTK